jgi:hypothetical protein
MVPNRPARRLVGLLASLKLGVSLLVVLAVVCAAATVYESRHGTAAAQRAFYHTGWFAALLAALAVNILFAVVRKYPWSRHQAGFLMAHAGILVLLGGSLLSLHLGLDGQLALFEGEEGSSVALPAAALQVALPGHQAHGTFTLDPARGGSPQRFRIAGSSVTAVVDEALAHAEAREDLVAAPGGSPAVHFVLRGSFGQQDGWLLAGDPERWRVDFGPVAFELRAEGDTAPAGPAGRNAMAFTAAGDGLRYVLSARQGAGSRGAVELGRGIPTPWMGMEVAVERYLPSAVMRRTVAAAPAPAQEERRVPAVRVRLEGLGGATEPEWVLWNEARQVPMGAGRAAVAFRAAESALPFRVTLLDFRSEKYPGSDRAATYESRVRLDDPEQGASEHVISMNRPLRHRGYVLFQASYMGGEEGAPAGSVFSVARAPGLPLVYLGTALISLGVAWMFYGQAWVARRRVRHRVAAATT